MLLFLTREAFFRFSIDPRFGGDGEVFENELRFSRLPPNGEVGSRPCQKSRGEVVFGLVRNGEESNGEDSFDLKMLA